MSSFAFVNLDVLNNARGGAAGSGGAAGHGNHHRLPVAQQVRPDLLTTLRNCTATQMQHKCNTNATPHHTQAATGHASSSVSQHTPTATRRSARRRAARVATPTPPKATVSGSATLLPDLDALDWEQGVEAMRQVGNQHYGRADYAAAIDAYMRALDVVDANALHTRSMHAVRDARVLLHNNLAAAFLELGMFNLALREAEAVCEIDTMPNIKALLRRGKALYGMGDMVTARLMFSRVLDAATSGYSAERADAQMYLDTIERTHATHIMEVDGEEQGGDVGTSEEDEEDGTMMT